jgi:seryl-tRNA synthetase
LQRRHGKNLAIEVWIPSMNEYKEVSSARMPDYQLGAEISFKRKDGKKRNLFIP